MKILTIFFLMIFILQHFAINILSVFDPELFNDVSHFMGTNPLVQFVLQPVLIFGVVFHFLMGFVLEFKNRASRSVSYAVNNGNANSTWMSRNMIYSGLAILAFMVLHFIDFWIPEMNYKYVEVLPEDPNRYFEELVHKFESPIRTLIYSLSFIFLALHLLHGFSSSFKPVGVNSKYYDLIQKSTFIFSITIPLGFIFIAIFHNLTS